MFRKRNTITTMTRAAIDFPSRIGVWWAGDTWSMPDAQQVARDADRTTVIVSKVRASDWTEGGAFWQVGVP